MLNEFRQDLVSGEWVLFATGRAKRPEERKNTEPTEQPKATCPFEDLENSGNEVLKTYPVEEGFSTSQATWFAKVAKNKYPAVIEGEVAERQDRGPFSITPARGLHEVIIYREHERSLTDFSSAELAQVLTIYQERFRAMASYAASRYILIFHNQGPTAGASLLHPHSQIISIPILPPDIKRSIFGAERFFREHGRRVHEVMLEWELKEKKRIIDRTEHFVAFCPFV